MGLKNRVYESTEDKIDEGDNETIMVLQECDNSPDDESKCILHPL